MGRVPNKRSTQSNQKPTKHTKPNKTITKDKLKPFQVELSLEISSSKQSPTNSSHFTTTHQSPKSKNILHSPTSSAHKLLYFINVGQGKISKSKKPLQTQE